MFKTLFGILKIFLEFFGKNSEKIRKKSEKIRKKSEKNRKKSEKNLKKIEKKSAHLFALLLNRDSSVHTGYIAENTS